MFFMKYFGVEGGREISLAVLQEKIQETKK
jgi:hypothetical protein